MFNILSKRRLTQITAHILDPKIGYTKQHWEVGKDISADAVDKLANVENVYIVTVYEDGIGRQIACQKDVWMQAKDQYDSIDRTGHHAMQQIHQQIEKSQLSGSDKESSSDSIYVDIDTFDKTAVLISGNQMVQISGAIFVTLILALSSEGWKDGNEMFIQNTGILKLGRHQISKESASQLANMLRTKIAGLASNELAEAEKPINDLIRIASLGAFTIDFVDCQ